MNDDFLSEPRRALEEAFFAKHNERLRRALKERAEAEERRQALAEASGITDPAVLDELIELEIEPEAVAAFALIPLVEVAWADGDVHVKEREAILQAAQESGLAPGGVARELLQSWLSERPGSQVLKAWETYTAALAGSLDASGRTRLRKEIVGRARAVAEAAGGILGLGSKISAAEREMIEKLEKAFG